MTYGDYLYEECFYKMCAKFDKAMSLVEKLQKERDKLLTDLAANEAGREYDGATMREYEQEIAQLQVQVDSLQQKVHLTAAYDALLRERDEWKGHATKISHRLLDITRERDELKADREKGNADYSELMTRHDRLFVDNADLRRILDEAPHAVDCASIWYYPPGEPCDCFKSGYRPGADTP